MPKQLLRDLKNILESEITESKTIVNTDKIGFDFDLVRKGVQRAVKKDFGSMVVYPRFGAEKNKFICHLSIKFKGLGQIDSPEFAELAAPTMREAFGKEARVKVDKNSVEYLYILRS